VHAPQLLCDDGNEQRDCNGCPGDCHATDVGREQTRRGTVVAEDSKSDERKSDNIGARHPFVNTVGCREISLRSVGRIYTTALRAITSR
jgi:hypothetical protein